MIDIVGAEALAREFCQEEILFVGGVIRADHAELPLRALASLNFVETTSSALRPGNRLEAFFGPHHGRLQALGVLGEVEGVAALHAQELVVDAAAVAVVAANDLVVADTQSRLAAIGAMGADGADVFHFPGASLIAIGSAGERAYRANVDAGAAFVAFQMVVHGWE